jgi:hypothetical protein
MPGDITAIWEMLYNGSRARASAARDMRCPSWRGAA